MHSGWARKVEATKMSFAIASAVRDDFPITRTMANSRGNAPSTNNPVRPSARACDPHVTTFQYESESLEFAYDVGFSVEYFDSSRK